MESEARFQSLKGIRVNFGFNGGGGDLSSTQFQSLKGIRVNFGVTSDDRR